MNPDVDDLRADFRRWFRRIEDYFENHTASHIAAKGAVIVITVGAFIVEAHNLLGESTPKRLASILLLAFLVVALVVDYGHVKLASRRKREVLKRDRHIRSLIGVIRQSATLQDNTYRMGQWRIEQRVDNDGNSEYVRKVWLEFDGTPVYTMKMMVGAIAGGRLVDDISELRIVARSLHDGAPLLWVVTDDTPSKKDIVVILDPPLKAEGDVCGVEISLRWPGLWSPLVTDYQDEGMVHVEHGTEHLELEFLLPNSLQFTSFRVTPSVGGHIIDEAGGHSRLTFRADNLAVNDRLYYRLYCKENKNPS